MQYPLRVEDFDAPKRNSLSVSKPEGESQAVQTDRPLASEPES